MLLQSDLGQRHAGRRTFGMVDHAREQDHQRCGRADHQRIYKDAKPLHQPLTGRMVRIGHRDGGDVRGRAHARLIREQTALHTVEQGHHEAPRKAACRRFETKGRFDDQGQHGGHIGDVQNHDEQRHDDIEPGHSGNDLFRDPRDGFDPAEDDDARKTADDKAGDEFGNGKGFLHRDGDRVCLHRREDQAEADDEADRKDIAHGVRPDAPGHVEGRPATVLPIRVPNLVKLRQGRFRIGRRHADERHNPHPEHSPRPAEIDRHGHPGEVARTDPAGERDRQRLKW